MKYIVEILVHHSSFSQSSTSNSDAVQTEKSNASAKEKKSNTVSIKTRYDFAGEEVE